MAINPRPVDRPSSPERRADSPVVQRQERFIQLIARVIQAVYDFFSGLCMCFRGRESPVLAPIRAERVEVRGSPQSQPPTPRRLRGALPAISESPPLSESQIHREDSNSGMLAPRAMRRPEISSPITRSGSVPLSHIEEVEHRSVASSMASSYSSAGSRSRSRARDPGRSTPQEASSSVFAESVARSGDVSGRSMQISGESGQQGMGLSSGQIPASLPPVSGSRRRENSLGAGKDKEN